MGIRPAIASIPNERDILKAPSIYMAALLCILPRVFNGYNKGTWL